MVAGFVHLLGFINQNYQYYELIIVDEGRHTYIMLKCDRLYVVM